MCDAWNRGDAEVVVELFSPAAEVHGALNRRGEAYAGHDGVRRWLSDVAGQFDPFQIASAEFRETPVGELALGRILAESKAGAVLDQPVGFVARREGDRIGRLDAFLDHAAAERAAG
jgi:ketosteroid isomerase-like protein